MSTNDDQKRVPLLKYWTIRYLLVLLSSLIIVASWPFIGPRNGKKYNLQLNRLFAQEMAERIGSEGKLVINSAMWNRFLSATATTLPGTNRRKPLPNPDRRPGGVIFQPDIRMNGRATCGGFRRRRGHGSLDAGERAWYIVAGRFGGVIG